MLTLIYKLTVNMPGRKVILANEETYHIFNRGIISQPIFLSQRDYQRAFKTFIYYQNNLPPLKYSAFNRQSKKRQKKINHELKKRQDFLVEIIAFCLMPTHFHFLLKQVKDKGISIFISKFSNSYTRYFNLKNKRKGVLFEGRFKAVRIKGDEQLLHVSRYIHLNPFTSYLIRNIDSLADYAFSSFPEYLGKTRNSFCQKKDVLGQFKNSQAYEKFVLDQADYQRKLQDIKHLMLDNK